MGRIYRGKSKKTLRKKKPGVKKKYTLEQIKEALDQSEGRVYPAAALLKCSVRTIYKYIERYPDKIKYIKNGKKRSYTKEEIIEALKKCGGFVSVAAKMVGCTPNTIYTFRNTYPEVKQIFDEIKEEKKDFVENKLWNKIKNDDTTCILFYLKCIAKDRGYVERQEHKVEGGVKLESIIDALPPELAEQVCEALRKSISDRRD